MSQGTHGKKHRDPRNNSRLLLGAAGATLLARAPVTVALARLADTTTSYATDAEKRALRAEIARGASRGIFPVYTPLSRIGAFSPTTRRAYFYNTRVGLHEYGHSNMLNKSVMGAVRRANMPLYSLGGAAVRSPLALAAAGLIGASTARDKTDSVANRAAVATALPAVPMLFEEGMANLSAVKSILRANGIKGALPSMRYLGGVAPALGTYAAYGLAPALAAYALGKAYENRNKRERDKRRS